MELKPGNKQFITLVTLKIKIKKMIIAVAKLKIFSMALFILISASAIQFPISKDFSGLFRLNLAKSDFSQADPSVSCNEFDIAQYKDSIMIKRIILNEDGSQKENKEILDFDGRKVGYQIDYGTKKASVKWSNHNQVLTRIAEYDLDYGTSEKHYTTTEVLSLSEDGKMLTDNLTIEHKAGRKYSVKAVYDKQ